MYLCLVTVHGTEGTTEESQIRPAEMDMRTIGRDCGAAHALSLSQEFRRYFSVETVSLSKK